ncbi:Hypothetical predicted protein [Olea europaea subsp. europaea]|uniref:Uncharacterized protein n=1 Tax=Olea europaea subsp. europaea TaxID=158383 RepID=A0A8S0V6J9_OLEEU|nr:Hypothetical predicted protein [Olea europaea subsp. europaea]
MVGFNAYAKSLEIDVDKELEDYTVESGKLATMFILGPFAIGHHLIPLWANQVDDSGDGAQMKQTGNPPQWSSNFAKIPEEVTELHFIPKWPPNFAKIPQESLNFAKRPWEATGLVMHGSQFAKVE